MMRGDEKTLGESDSSAWKFYIQESENPPSTSTSHQTKKMTTRLARLRNRREKEALESVESFVTPAERSREEMVDSMTELCNGFIQRVLGASALALKYLQVPKASAETTETNLGPPPVGYVEGLCHMIAVASTQLKLSPELHGRVAEGLRKQFLTLTNAMANLFDLSQTNGLSVSKKVEPILKAMETESEMTLENFYEHEISRLNYRLAIAQSPNTKCIQATWEETPDDDYDDDEENDVSLKVHWDPFTHAILCTLATDFEFSFSETTVDNQLKIFNSFLVQAFQSVQKVASVLESSNDNWKKAQHTLSGFMAYFRRLESRDEIRPEEKDALLLVLRAHVLTTHHLLDQLKRTLKRARVSLSHAIWNIRAKLKLLENENQVTDINSKGNPFGYSVISLGIRQPLYLILFEGKKEIEEVISEEAKEFNATWKFFSRLTETTEELTGECLSSLLATHELLCGHVFGRHGQSQSKVIGSILLLGQTLVSIGNFRDCSNIQRSLISNGLKELLAKFNKFLLGSSVQEKLKQELEAIQREVDLISVELRVLMNVLMIPPKNDTPVRIWEDPTTTTSADTTTSNLWTLKLCHQFSGASTGGSPRLQLVLFFRNMEIKYTELTRVKQGRVVVEVIRFLLSLVDEVFLSLRAAIKDLRKGAENLKSIKTDLTTFIKNEGYGPDIELGAELNALINLLHRTKGTAGETFRQINSEMKKATEFLQGIDSYARTRFRLEARHSSAVMMVGPHGRRLKPLPGYMPHRNEQAQQIQRKNKKRVSDIEAALQASLQEAKVIQIPLKLNIEGRRFSEAVTPLEVK